MPQACTPTTTSRCTTRTVAHRLRPQARNRHTATRRKTRPRSVRQSSRGSPSANFGKRSSGPSKVKSRCWPYGLASTTQTATASTDDDFVLLDDEWDAVSDGFDDRCRWDEWEILCSQTIRCFAPFSRSDTRSPGLILQSRPAPDTSTGSWAERFSSLTSRSSPTHRVTLMSERREALCSPLRQTAQRPRVTRFLIE